MDCSLVAVMPPVYYLFMKLFVSNATHVSANPSRKLVWKSNIMQMSARSSGNGLCFLQISSYNPIEMIFHVEQYRAEN
jgi:hypothetical protein